MPSLPGQLCILREIVDQRRCRSNCLVPGGQLLRRISRRHQQCFNLHRGHVLQVRENVRVDLECKRRRGVPELFAHDLDFI